MEKVIAVLCRAGGTSQPGDDWCTRIRGPVAQHLLDLGRRLARMVASTSSFGASENIDTVPASRYVLRTPFAAKVQVP